MYDEYDVVYESSTNEYLILWIILGVAIAILLLIILISLSKVFKKANRSGISAFIPIQNFNIMLEIANMSKSSLLPMLIPIINIPVLLNVNIKIANLFKKTKLFGLGMTFLPIIYYPILAFSSSEYAGINLSGMNSKIPEAIPVIDDTKNQEKEIQVNEEVKPTVSISTGVGKLENFKKEEVDFDKLLQKPVKQEVIEEPVINPEEGAKLKNGEDIYNVSYIETEAPKVEEQSQPQVEPQQSIPQPTNKNVDLLASNTVKPGEDGYKLCPNCGTRVLDDAEMCMICGQKLN